MTDPGAPSRGERRRGRMRHQPHSRSPRANCSTGRYETPAITDTFDKELSRLVAEKAGQKSHQGEEIGIVLTHPST